MKLYCLKRKRFYLYASLIVLLGICQHLCAQPYAIGRMDTLLIDQQREDRNIPIRIFFPADTMGSGLPVRPTDAHGFPVIVFGHGYLMPADAYQNLWEWIVPQGYVFVVPESSLEMFPSHLEFGRDMSFVLDEMIRLGSTPDFYLSGSIGVTGCLMGHSMGGGSAVFAAGMTNSAKALLLLAPLNSRSSAAEAARDLHIPALVIAGTDDRVTPLEKNAQPIYDSLQGEQKTLLAILGGNHCQMAAYHLLCRLGEASLDMFPGISRKQQHRVLETFMLPWLNYFLYGDLFSAEEFRLKLRSDPAVLFEARGAPGELIPR